MGVRFLCPNGHKLNVKANLAGKRGICPDCGARFIVPHYSGGRVEPAEDIPPRPAESPVGLAELAGNATESIVIATERLPARAAVASTPGVQADAMMWYVRPAGGGQFGPATTSVFQQWIEEGRVANDSWVWRTGWADWKPGSEALALAAQPPPLEPVAAIAAALDAALAPTPLNVAAQTPVEPASASARRAELKRRKQKIRRISTILGVVALLMLVVLVGVLSF